eukprot:TRINITY_DN43817_c0_g1_i3.p1 TRINITY_DN43817_c0_g1~~TRINITY_DN43817_c0_g1_i3.p1  ORF type:complete len:208 (-),score=54.11 TRINITY_DN43817_c0_g1_i3:27-650(-)
MCIRDRTRANCSDSTVHLSNTAINSGNEGSECKKDLEEALAMMAGAGLDTARLWAEIKDRVIGHTLAGLHPILALSYEAAFGDRADRSRCYQVLGFDVMLDEGGRPFLLEINANPSFAVPTPLDLRVKGSVLANTIVEVLGTEPVWDQCSGLLPLESDHIDVPKLGDHEAVLSEALTPVSYTHLRAHETPEHLVCRLLLEKKKKKEK